MEKQDLEKVNSAVFKADFTKYADQVRTEGRPIVIQRNNKDLCALVPLEALNPERKARKRRAGVYAKGDVL